MNTLTPVDIAGQHIGRKLNAAVGAADGAGDGPRQHCFADAGYIFNEQVAFAQQSHYGHAYLPLLADDDLLDVGKDALGDVLHFLHGVFLMSVVHGEWFVVTRVLAAVKAPSGRARSLRRLHSGQTN